MPAGDAETALSIEDVAFRYPGVEGFEIDIPRFCVRSGDSVAVVGPSGSGKTTLLGLLAGTLRPRSGRIRIDSTELTALDDGALRRFRIRHIGQVFQAFELLPYLSVVENVMLPHFIYSGREPRRQARERALDVLGEVGLADKAGSYPERLSQGERQRVAVCRAMINRPALLLADEPTGNLDQRNKQIVVDLLLEQAKRHDSTLLMVTHDQALLGSFARVVDIDEIRRPTGEGVPA